MKSFTAAETINATPEQLWQILTDAGAYGDWDNGISTVEGSIAEQAHIKVHPTGEATTHEVTITEATPERRMVWREGMPLGLFTEVRTFRLLSEREGTTRFSLSEEVSGPLTIFKRKRLEAVQGELDAFAAGLKQVAEAA